MALKIRAPGPIAVPPLRDETASRDLPADRLTTYLRQKLNEVNIRAPEPIPGGAQQIDFAEVLHSPAADTTNVGASLAINVGKLLAAGNISYAYQVDGALFNSEDGKCGVTVQVMVLPKWASQPFTSTDETWELAIDKAAYEVCAFILPLTKLVDKPPWQAWRRLAVPGRLFKDVQQAQQFKADRRFDEALGSYYKALELDPRNPYLRLEVGLLQEQLGLYLDALVTYEDVINLAPSNRDLKVYHPIARMPVYLRRRDVFIRRGWWRVPLLMARYRQAILLGMGERLSAEWSPSYEVSGLRAEQCETLRRRIKETYEGHFRGFQQYLHDQGGELGKDKTTPSHHVDPIPDVLLPNGPLAGRPERLLQQEFFQFLGQVKAQQLCRAYFFPRIIPERKVPRAALRLLLVCNPVRRCYTRSLRLEHSHALKYLAAYRVIKRPAIANAIWQELRRFEFAHGRAGMQWPVEARDVSKRVLFGRHGMRLSRLFPHWQDFYDEACIYAVCMTPDKGEPPEQDAALADRAVKSLEKSLRLQDSGFASTICSWVREYDPDLVVLQRRQEFADWANRHFPETRPNPFPPDNVQKIELLHYEQLLIERSASKAAAVWDYRSTHTSNGSLPPKKFEEWLEDEKEAWDLAAKLVENRRHWRTRYEFINVMRDFGRESSSNEVPNEFTVRYPSFSDDPLICISVDGNRYSSTKIANGLKMRERRINDLANILKNRRDWCADGLPSSECPKDISKFCTQLARRWETLAKAFREQMDDGEFKPIVPVGAVGRRPDAF
ncbi:hypothetical protein KEF29_31065 [Streptomyces tuirus]|uniref:Tetratricopeptide repeat protein n=1 Tax=Streptomyces tuirus TaxID=68278 RepID=A0A941J7Z1_9ACTN|nr:hypothetical protein [Streptomyces tuirus]